jgi:hypothetical protein
MSKYNTYIKMSKKVSVYAGPGSKKTFSRNLTEEEYDNLVKVKIFQKKNRKLKNANERLRNKLALYKKACGLYREIRSCDMEECAYGDCCTNNDCQYFHSNEEKDLLKIFN